MKCPSCYCHSAWNLAEQRIPFYEYLTTVCLYVLCYNLLENWYRPCRPTISMSLLTSAIHYVIMAFMANHFNPIRGYNCSDNSDNSYGDSMYAMSHEQLCSAIELKAQRACVYIVVKPVKWPLYKSQSWSIGSYKATIIHDISGLYGLSTSLNYTKF